MTINSVAMEIVEAGYSNASLRYNSLLKGYSHEAPHVFLKGTVIRYGLC